jgi:transposase
MKAYSLDLRQKILDAYLHNDGSIRAVAQRFKVSFRFVWGLVHHFRHTGSYAPKPHGGGNPPRISAGYHDLLRRLVAAHADATLAELCDLFAQETAITLSKSSMHRTVEKLKLTRKKKRFVRQNKHAMMSSNSGKLIGR